MNKEIYIRESQRGYLEAIDLGSGNIAWRQKLNPKQIKMIYQNGKIKQSPQFFSKSKGRPAIIKYSRTLADQIIDFIILGYSIRKIGTFIGSPGKDRIYYWLRAHPDFRAEIKSAKKFHKIIKEDWKIDQVILSL